ncbi:MAG: hypothetical protein ACP59X_21045 [Solidesulfovibrio sp. DCME]|uniref:hypothetical protein n=1 Tax=Solidesulfovibrio sp. DCME TaxID=3447380 RepID=UPI003D0BB1E0
MISKLSDPPAWTATWTPGNGLEHFCALYDSRGDATIGTDTAIATTLDGPIQVARYDTLTLAAVMTAAVRCRGLMLVADNLVLQAAGKLSMDGRGAAGNAGWPVDRDLFVPQSITFTGRHTSYRRFLDWIRQTGFCIFDPVLYAAPPPGMGDVRCDWATWVPHGVPLVTAAGCGAGGAGLAINYNWGVYAAGNAGAAGSGGPGGGGSGGAACMANNGAGSAGRGGHGRIWGGGPGGGAAVGSTGKNAPADPGDPYGGPGGAATSGVPDTNGAGGGAGNPGGAGVGAGVAGSDGTGGTLAAFVRQSATLASGHVISAAGKPGGAGSNGPGGGGSGGGIAGLFVFGGVTGTPNLVATGGAGGTGGDAPGGAGGDGHVLTTSFAAMGWS